LRRLNRDYHGAIDAALGCGGVDSLWRVQMYRNIFRGLALLGLLTFSLSLALCKVKYPKTAVCPIDNVTAKATGRTKPTDDPKCVAVEYQHKWTDYSDFRHPQRMRHEFWVGTCGEGSVSGLTPSQ
jgi:hypothetical protein